MLCAYWNSIAYIPNATAFWHANRTDFSNSILNPHASFYIIVAPLSLSINIFLSLSLSLKNPNTSLSAHFTMGTFPNLSLCPSLIIVYLNLCFFLAFIPSGIFRNNLLQIFGFLWALIWIILTFIWIYQ